MGHLTVKNYKSLYKRMDQLVNGPFDSEEFYQILKTLFTDEEALLCSALPILPSPIEKISKIWETSEEEAESILNTLVSKGLIYEDDYNGSVLYSLAIPVFGFFEFSLMRTDGMFDHDLLSNLYTKYINDDDNFVKKYFGGKTIISRAYVQEETLPEDMTSEILSYEKSSHIIDAADMISVGICFCRHKMEHMGQACDKPQDVCLSFGNIAKSLVEKGIAREISKPEAHDILKQCVDNGLAQIGDNIKNKPAVICNCCGCCCDLLLSYKKTGMSTIISPSNYIAEIDDSVCTNCGVCIEKCPADAISLIGEKTVVDKNWCLGCGVCSNFCKTKACKMKAREEKVFVPEDTFQKVVLAVIYQGKLGNVLFENQKSITHKILRTSLNFIVKLPPVKWLLLQEKIQNFLVDFTLKIYGIENFKL
ncbi:MAG: 4Fe-4S binding protein [Deltaproteobacteria bacterium]|nr:4Fe-4S binding protein [Deltaproteobacteria bacterium]